MEKNIFDVITEYAINEGIGHGLWQMKSTNRFRER